MTREPLNPQQRLTVIGVAVALVSLIAAYTITLPRYRAARTDQLKSESVLAARLKDNEDLKEVEQQLTLAESQLAAVGVTKDKIAAVVPATEQIPELYIQLEQLMRQLSAADAGTGLRDGKVSGATYTLGVPQKQGDLVEIAVSVQASGDYTAIKSFVASLQQNIRPLVFRTISITRTTTAEGKAVGGGTLTVNLSGAIFAHDLSSAYSEDDN
jgi:Tfp pilus assembly protein PilO